ncbi:MAG TPA: YebC/PmpR family DNA-binding transcriptional regulator [Candidatus Brocadiia bacterium]|mgnify:CR=1 FL=1|nr:YebC/PmpR family DNA-binding transcriptional regulator [Candidatus Brocadiia bacterium]
MSGHSHWATIRRKKDVVDAKKGKIFSKLARSIMAIARQGGGDPASNIRLKALLDEARACRMPKENIDRAIKKGTGELEGATLEEIVYEAYGPGGAAIMMDILTDNRNRTASELRKIIETHGGTLAGSGAVSWLFNKKGLIAVLQSAAPEDKLFELVVEAGAEDMEKVGETYQITCQPADFEAVRQAIEKASIPIESAQITKLPSTTVQLDEDNGAKILKLMDALDDHDDIQNVYSNFELPPSLMSE